MPTTFKVIDSDELADAVQNAVKGDRIEVTPTLVRYVIKNPLVLADGVTLEGGGLMQGIPLPTGFVLNSQATLEADPTLAGDILTLGDGTLVRGLTIRDVAGRQGNLVVLSSTKVDDRISASIDECELINPNPSSGLPSGPIGRGLLVITRNPPGAPPAPHEGARVSARMHRTIIRSPGNGSGVFAINFAPRARVNIRLSHNIIGGGLDANGGVCRPVAVLGSETFVYSYHNIYRSDGATAAFDGWILNGGCHPPFSTPAVPATNGNALVMISEEDRIEGFSVGVRAAGGWRRFDTSGTVNFNYAHLHLRTLRVTSVDSDFILFGARCNAPATGSPPFPPGDDNRLCVIIEGPCQGSGRLNSYADAAEFDGGALPQPGSGNRLEILANNAMVGISPPPAAFLM